jgi:hypothetical protein
MLIFLPPTTIVRFTIEDFNGPLGLFMACSSSSLTSPGGALIDLWIIPLQVAQAVFTGDFTGLSKSIGQRDEPSAEAQRRQLHARTIEQSEPHEKVMEQVAQAGGGAPPAHSHSGLRGDKPKSRNRAARTATLTRTKTIQTKSKRKKPDMWKPAPAALRLADQPVCRKSKCRCEEGSKSLLAVHECCNSAHSCNSCYPE